MDYWKHGWVQDLPVLDVHEHHMPEVLLGRDVGLVDLFRQGYSGWTCQRPYALPSEVREKDPMLSASSDVEGWDSVSAFVEDRGSSAFVRNLVWALSDLYSLSGGEITSENWEELDGRIRERHRDPSWVAQVLDRAGIEGVITDCYLDPLIDAAQALGPRYRSVLRVNSLALGWNRIQRDHNGNQAFELAERMGLKGIATLEEYDDFLALAVQTARSRGRLALKNALAYDRDVDFAEPDIRLVRQAWQKENPSPEERKAFGDWVMDRLCGWAAREDLPVQVHLGTGIIRGSHPMKFAGLVERHPRTRFLLMHLAYPWSRDLLGLAFVYRNVWLDLTWAPLLSPSHFKLALHEAIEVLPDEGRMMVGGDNWHVEETYGAIRLMKYLLGEVMEEKIAAGYFSRGRAERLAGKILRKNGMDFFAW